MLIDIAIMNKNSQKSLDPFIISYNINGDENQLYVDYIKYVNDYYYYSLIKKNIDKYFIV